MGRHRGYINRQGYDEDTGKQAWKWWWGCKELLWAYSPRYLDGRQYHDGWLIKENAVRKRLSDIRG
jgi:hypothetical protein